MHSRLVKGILISLFAVLFLLYWLVRDPASFSTLDSFAYFAASLPALAAAFYVSRVYGWKNAHGKAFLILSVGILIFISGNVLALIDQAITAGKLAAFPYTLFSLGYLVVFLGLGREVTLHGFNPKRFDAQFFIGTSLFLLLIGGAILYTGLRAFDPAAPLSENLSVIIFPILDLGVALFIVFIMQIVREYQGGRLFYSWLTLSLSISLFLLGDIFFSALSAWKIPTVWPFTFVNLVWTGGFILAAYGCFSIGAALQGVQQLMMKTSHRRSDH